MYQDIKSLSEYIIMYSVVHLKIWTQRPNYTDCDLCAGYNNTL